MIPEGLGFHRNQPALKKSWKWREKIERVERQATGRVPRRRVRGVGGAREWAGPERRKCPFLIFRENLPDLKLGKNNKYDRIPCVLLWKQKGENKPNNIQVDGNTLEKCGHKADEKVNVIFFLLFFI